jgi:hypothetical protein
MWRAYTSAVLVVVQYENLLPIENKLKFASGLIPG